jgi:serine beta-lactamase-like protein LACTB, mitochondrial
MKEVQLKAVHIMLFSIGLLSAWSEAQQRQPTAATLADSTPYEQQVSQLFNSLIEVTAVPAFSVAIVHHGKLVAAVAAGQTDPVLTAAANESGAFILKQPVTPAHLFRLASVSKVVGASMLAELVLENKLNPDTPIGQYDPALDPKYHRITIRQLLAHTSGMPHYQPMDAAITAHHYDSAVAALATLKGRSLQTAPGAAYLYSSHGYTLAGAIYEKITKQTLEQSVPAYIQALTGKPTPMIENVLRLNAPPADRQFVDLYERSGKQMHKVAFEDYSYSVFGAGMSATAPDLAQFGAAILQKSRGDDRYRQLLFSAVTTSSGTATGNGQYQVGFGWRIGQTQRGNTIYHHAGVNDGARSVLLLYPEHDLVIALLSNSRWTASIEQTADALVELYLASAATAGTTPSLATHASYSLDYDGASYAGKLRCNAQQCVLQQDQSKLSDWLQQFNPTEPLSADIPLFVAGKAKGQQLILVSKVGFIPLFAEGNTQHYSGTVAGNRKVRLTLTNLP